MKRNSILFLIFLLLLSCRHDGTTVSTCADSPPGYYDIQNMVANDLLYEGTNPDSYSWYNTRPIPAGQTVTNTNFIVELESSGKVDYVNNQRKFFLKSSLISSAYACTRALPATYEIISAINITSNNDFDAMHPAGSNLNDLFTVEYTHGTGVDADFYLNGVKKYTLNEFVAAAPQGMRKIHLKLIQDPVISKIQNFKIEYTQTDGDYYEMFLENIIFE
ncbi:MAG: hypothetical protein ACC657_14990 [Thiohalomonadales bacterium]